nr:hypothetical protein Iba_chr15aCG2170 [Ipomoea batatas]
MRNNSEFHLLTILEERRISIQMHPLEVLYQVLLEAPSYKKVKGSFQQATPNHEAWEAHPSYTVAIIAPPFPPSPDHPLACQPCDSWQPLFCVDREIEVLKPETELRIKWTFLTASVREASGAPKNFSRAGETLIGFKIPLGRPLPFGAVVAPELEAAELFAAAIRIRQPLPKIRADEAMFSSVNAKTLESEK